MKQQKSQRVVTNLKDDAVSSDFCHNCINNEKSGDSDSVVPQTNGKVAKIYESSKDGLKVVKLSTWFKSLFYSRFGMMKAFQYFLLHCAYRVRHIILKSCREKLPFPNLILD